MSILKNIVIILALFTIGCGKPSDPSTLHPDGSFVTDYDKENYNFAVDNMIRFLTIQYRGSVPVRDYLDYCYKQQFGRIRSNEMIVECQVILKFHPEWVGPYPRD